MSKPARPSRTRKPASAAITHADIKLLESLRPEMREALLYFARTTLDAQQRQEAAISRKAR